MNKETPIHNRFIRIEIIDIDHWAKIDQTCLTGTYGARGRLRQEILKRDNYRCVYCGDTNGPFEIDHVFPRSRGGSDSPTNLVCSCKYCNQSKCDKTPEEWIEKVAMS